jgi:hypothetical protein
VADSNVSTHNFETSNIISIVEGFGLDFITEGTRFTDIHFDIDEGEDLREVLRELGILNIDL